MLDPIFSTRLILKTFNKSNYFVIFPNVPFEPKSTFLVKLMYVFRGILCAKFFYIREIAFCFKFPNMIYACVLLIQH
jgi:hypothetical protein